MIFVTVGTHEQGFERLVEKIDNLVEQGVIQDKVFIQTGYTKYEPKYCEFAKFLGFEEMTNFYKNSSIIITHGGPASFMDAIKLNKVPIVVPRLKQYNEHINDHQLIFCKEVERRLGGIILIEDVEQLKEVIMNYDKNSSEIMTFKYNNLNFCKELDNIINELFGD